MVKSGPSDVKLGNVLRLLQGHERWMVLSTMLSLGGFSLALAQPLVVKTLIDGAADGDPVAWGHVAVLVALFLGQALAQTAARYTLSRTGEDVVLRIRHAIIDHTLRLTMRSYDAHRIGDLLSRVGADSTALRTVVAQGLTHMVTGVLSLLGAIALMFWIDWFLFATVALFVVISASLITLVFRTVRVASRSSQDALAAMASDLERALVAIRTVRTSQAEYRETRRIGGRAQQVYAANMQIARLEAVVGPASELAVTGAFLAAFLVGGIRVASGASALSDVVPFLLYVTYLIMPIGYVFQGLSAVQQGAGALTRIDELMELPAETVEQVVADQLAPSRASRTTAWRTSEDGNGAAVLEFKNVWFCYDTRRPVLRDVSFQLPTRGHVALIGPSGAGKSTIFALIERFYDPDSGVIRFKGRDIRLSSIHALRSRIGMVEQDAPVLHGTLWDNVTYAAPDATEEQVRRVIPMAHLGDVVARSPDGLDTQVGEHGMMLSGGERQRVAIARSLLPRPDLLLLDEPASQLDPVSEAALTRALEQVATECALFVIAHRLSTVQAAARVIVLDRGEIVAMGRHEELRSANDYYRRVVATLNQLDDRDVLDGEYSGD